MSGNPFNRCTQWLLTRITAIFTCPMATAMPGSTSIPPMASCCFLGASRARDRASSTSHTTSPRTKTDGYTWPTGRTTASRFRPQRKLRDSVDQHGPSLRPLHRSNGGSEPSTWGELGVAIGANSQAAGLGPRITIMDVAGNTWPSWRLAGREAPGTFIAPTGCASTPEATSTWPKFPGLIPVAAWTRPGRSDPSKSWSRPRQLRWDLVPKGLRFPRSRSRSISLKPAKASEQGGRLNSVVNPPNIPLYKRGTRGGFGRPFKPWSRVVCLHAS